MLSRNCGANIAKIIANSPTLRDTNHIKSFKVNVPVVVNLYTIPHSIPIIAKIAMAYPIISIIDIDMTRSENVRRWWPFLRDRRIDAYKGITSRFLD